MFNGITESYQRAVGDLLRSRGVLLSADDVLFPLSVADVEMVDVNGVPYTMDIDLNIIRAHFFKSNKDGNSLVYNPRAKPVVVQLQLSPTWYSMYVEWINDLEQKQLERDEAAEFGAKRKASGRPTKARKRGRTQASFIHHPQRSVYNCRRL